MTLTTVLVDNLYFCIYHSKLGRYQSYSAKYLTLITTFKIKNIDKQATKKTLFECLYLKIAVLLEPTVLKKLVLCERYIEKTNTKSFEK